jgi:hypothetical protein
MPSTMSRRAAMLTALTATTALPAPFVLAADEGVSTTLSDLLAAYSAAVAEEMRLDNKARQADEAFRLALRHEPLRIRLQRSVPDYLVVDGDWSAEAARAQFDRSLLDQMATCERVWERVSRDQPSLLRLIQSPESLRAEQAVLREEAEQHLTRYAVLEAEFDVHARSDEAAVACDARYAAHEALFAYAPRNHVEVKALAAFFITHCESTRRWRELPVHEFLKMIAA